tara:strand:+ start:704 stop:2284 length:1581 start_codon:yes stop_codon:yes gene_type:complete
MAAPAYTEDLTDMDLCEVSSNFLAIGGGNISLGAGTDFSMQGTNGVDAKVSNTEKGPGTPTTSFTPAANEHIFAWIYVATSGITDTLANRGACIALGSNSSNMVRFHVEGNNTYGASGRVGKCYPIRYVNTDNLGSIPYRTVTGSPPASAITFMGMTCNITSQSKGSNVGIDAFRYGTGAYLTAGELISAGDASDNPCSFAGFNVQNDLVANRWAILTSVGGGLELQGRFVIGQTNAGTATLCRFKDTNQNISIPDTPHTLSDFTQIIVDHASTRCEWTKINILALGTNNPGRVIVNAANPTFIITGGTWTDIGIVTFRSNTTSSELTLTNTGVITTNGAAMSDGAITDNTSTTGAIVINSPTEFAALSGINFTDNNRAIEITTAGTYSCDAHQFSGNTIEINFSGTGTCTVGPVNGSNVVQANCEATGGGTITVTAVTTQVTITGIPVGLEGRVRRGVVSLYHVQNITTGSFVYSYTGSAGKPFDLVIGGVSDAGDAYERNPLVLSEDGVAVTIPFTTTINPSYV